MVDNQIWYRGVMVSHQIANLTYRNVVRVRITAIPLATTQMTGTSGHGVKRILKGCCVSVCNYAACLQADYG